MSERKQIQVKARDIVVGLQNLVNDIAKHLTTEELLRNQQLLEQLLRELDDKLRQLEELRRLKSEAASRGEVDLDPGLDPFHWAAIILTIVVIIDIVTMVFLFRKSDINKKLLDLALRLLGLTILIFNIWPEVNRFVVQPFINYMINVFANTEGFDVENVQLDRYAIEKYSEFSALVATMASFTAVPKAIAMSVHPAVGMGASGYIDVLYWSLGFCYLTWMTTGPLLEAMVARPIEYYANLRFRTRLLSPSQYLKAYEDGLITEDELTRHLAMYGYTHRSIEILVKQARANRVQKQLENSLRVLSLARRMYQPMPVSTLINAYAAGIVDDTELVFELALQGRAALDQQTIQQLFQKALEKPEELRKAPWIEWCKFMADVRRRTTIAEYKLKLKWQGTISELIDAVARNVVDLDTAKKWLQESGYDEIFVKWFEARATEEKEKKQRKRRLTVSWLIRLYRYGIVNLNFVKEYLVSELGYDEADADLIVRYIEARYGGRTT